MFGLLEFRMACSKTCIAFSVVAASLENPNASTFTIVALRSAQSWMSATGWSKAVVFVPGQAWNGRYIPHSKPSALTWRATGAKPCGKAFGSASSRPSFPLDAHPFGALGSGLHGPGGHGGCGIGWSHWFGAVDEGQNVRPGWPVQGRGGHVLPGGGGGGLKDSHPPSILMRLYPSWSRPSAFSCVAESMISWALISPW